MAFLVALVPWVIGACWVALVGSAVHEVQNHHPQVNPPDQPSPPPLPHNNRGADHQDPPQGDVKEEITKSNQGKKPKKPRKQEVKNIDGECSNSDCSSNESGSNSDTEPCLHAAPSPPRSVHAAPSPPPRSPQTSESSGICSLL